MHLSRLPERLFTVQEAADYLRCSTSTIYKAVSAKRLIPHRLGGSNEMRFSEGQIAAFLGIKLAPGEQPPLRKPGRPRKQAS